MLNANGAWVSTRIFKQVMLISECNARMTELKQKGHIIKTSDHKDEFGFRFHRIPLKDPATTQETFENFWRELPSSQVDNSASS